MAKNIVICCDGNRVTKRLPFPLHFPVVWVIGLHHVEQSGEYVYFAAQLELRDGNAPTWLIRIAADFFRLDGATASTVADRTIHEPTAIEFLKRKKDR